MKNSANKFLLIAAVAAFSATSVYAQTETKDIVLDMKSKEPLPYDIDSRGVIVRSGTGLCWRTGYWTKELAAKTPVVGGEFPAGCYCDKDLMAKELCEPPPVVAKPVPMMKPSAEKITVAADALFDFDKAVLRPEGKAKLDDVASKAAAIKLETVIAVGYTDRIGSEAYNQKLSERRAAAVKDYMVGKGIPADRIYTEGKGKANPVTQPGDCKGKKIIPCLQPDRRVVIEVIGTK